VRDRREAGAGLASSRAFDARRIDDASGMKRISLSLATALVLAVVLSSAAYASCARTTPAEQRARADVIFDGVALEGPTATGIQRFRVTRYLKGRGPPALRVATGNIRRADGTGNVTSISIIVKRGERWRIFAQGRPPGVLRTSICDGSRKR
jgi:hypothetical protein